MRPHRKLPAGAASEHRTVAAIVQFAALTLVILQTISF